METEKADRLGELNGYQIAGLAALVSTVAALAVVFVLRRSGILGAPARASEAETQPAVPHSSSSGTPRHFSEELLVPGKTFTGQDVAEQDRSKGQSSEGI
jgi:hypothetical protein